MFFRIVTLLLCLCLLLLGVLLLPSAFSHADENKGPEKPEAEASNVQTEEQIIPAKRAGSGPRGNNANIFRTGCWPSHSLTHYWNDKRPTNSNSVYP